MSDCYEYVRKAYGVPAYVGVRVWTAQGSGDLVAANTRLHYVHVRLAGECSPKMFHPTDVTYIAHEGKSL